MNLRNEFTVAAPLERTWETLLDVPRVASALPGAVIERGGEGGDHRGRLKVKIGPVTAEYAGTARLEEVDEDGHAVTFHVQGSGAHGTAAAAIVGRLEPAGGGTRVVVETDLKVTGRAAQFGRGLMEEVASATLAEFAKRLEREIVEPRHTEAGRAEEPQALDLGAAAWEPLLRRYGLAVGIGLLLVVVLLLARRKPVVVVVRAP